MDLTKILDRTIEIVKEVGVFIKDEQKKISIQSVEIKGVHNFVTYVDKTAEKKIVEALKTIIPDAGFITEEGTINQKGDTFNWIIDPLDGTTNYIHGLNPVAISIALQQNNQTILGVVYEIYLDECFYATKNKPAYLNGEKIEVTKTNTISDSLIATGFPYYDYEKLPQFMQTLSFFMKNSHGLRRLGSAATDLAYVACGRFEAFYEYSLSAWDVAAGAFIVQQAGGKVSDFKGGNNYLFGREIIVANSNMFDEMQTEIKKIMNI